MESPPGQIDAAAGVVVPTTPSRRLRLPATWDDATRPPEGVAPLFTQEQLQQFGPQLKSRIANAIASQNQPVPSSSKSVEQSDEVIRSARLSAVERAACQAHLQNDHVPYRADCSTCLLAATTGHRHRRVKHPCPFSLALDIAGPFKTEGRDFDESRYRYLLVEAYRLPVQFFKDPSVEEEEVSEDKPSEVQDLTQLNLRLITGRI